MHELGDLGKQVVEIDETLSGQVQRAESLSEYAWKFCSPGGAGRIRGAARSPAARGAAVALRAVRDWLDAPASFV
jgi:hypothetical protein